MSFTQNRIKNEMSRGLRAEIIKYDDSGLLLEVSVSGITIKIIFTEKYPFHAPAVVTAGEYMNLSILLEENWKATCRINDIIQAITEESAG
jgi:hypothetical protein